MHLRKSIKLGGFSKSHINGLYQVGKLRIFWSFFNSCKAFLSSALMLESIFFGLLIRFSTLERNWFAWDSGSFRHADSIAVIISTVGTSLSVMAKFKPRASTHNSGSLRIRCEQFLTHLEMHSAATLFLKLCFSLSSLVSAKLKWANLFCCRCLHVSCSLTCWLSHAFLNFRFVVSWQ